LIPPLLVAFKQASDRDDLLRRLVAERGYYVPAFYDVQYAGDGTIASYVAREGTGAPPVVKKAALKTTDAVDPPATDHLYSGDRAGLALPRRSCPRLRQPLSILLGGLQLPARRAFPKDRILELAKRAQPYSKRAGLVSIALCDHPEIEPILTELVEMGYAISPASLRLDDLTPTILDLLRRSGERTITIAPETGSDRLRA
jgi:hypothetical protein